MTPGAKLGPYEIVALIGAGGMGEVYRAKDTKLKRDVALKVLPDAFAADPERMARFQREAEVLASLNHPNIAHIYGVEEQALVMELVEGESPQGPLALEEAWNIAMQMADALEYAHEKGIVHRDLKPANVKVTADGVVKLLDFGLAKAFTVPTAVSSNPENSPTLTLGATQLGVVLGTAGYMAPEQAKGKPVDKRADIWAWGVVLYGLLTGERLFQGEDAADTLAAVIHKQPDLGRVPPKVRRLLGECLQKDPKLRLRDIGDAKRLLEDRTVAAAPSGARLGWVVLLAVSAVLGLVVWRHTREEPPHLAKLFSPLPDKGVFETTRWPSVAVSPDGRRIAFEAIVGGKRGLWVRDLDNPTPRLLSGFGTDNRPEVPFWAPDSRRLGFFADGKLKKIDVTGGPAVTIASPNFRVQGTGTWNQDDVIVFSPVSTPALWKVTAAGGTPVPATELDQTRNETVHMMPWFLPDGRHFLYVASSSDAEKSGVYVGDLESKARKTVVIGATRAIYVNPGYLLYVRDRTLLAQHFDASRLETDGDAVPVAEQVAVTGSVTLGYFSASQNGVLVYTSGGAAGGGVRLTWFDRTGKRLDTAGAFGEVGPFSLSPDGMTVAFTRRDPQTGRFEIWTRDLLHSSESRLAFSGTSGSTDPVWSADGTRLFFRSDRDGTVKLYQKAANGTGTEEVVEAAGQQPTDASRDGRYLFTTSPRNPKTSNDIWVFPLVGERKAYPFIQTEFAEAEAKLSPNGRWLAYQSNETNRAEIYVASFPRAGGKWPISTNGGANPVWSRDGRELYYYNLADYTITAVDIKQGEQFQFGVPHPLFEVANSMVNLRFDVTKDGRFLVPALVEQEASAPMTVVLNWPELLKKK
jgi:serine/threonine protein kinase/Tol biopolymer transport system component